MSKFKGLINFLHSTLIEKNIIENNGWFESLLRISWLIDIINYLNEFKASSCKLSYWERLLALETKRTILFIWEGFFTFLSASSLSKGNKFCLTFWFCMKSIHLIFEDYWTNWYFNDNMFASVGIHFIVKYLGSNTFLFYCIYLLKLFMDISLKNTLKFHPNNFLSKWTTLLLGKKIVPIHSSIVLIVIGQVTRF